MKNKKQYKNGKGQQDNRDESVIDKGEALYEKP